MKPLASLEPGTARALRGLLFDLDDTLLSHGTLTRAAYGALWDMRDSGLRLVAVTGRPSGWGEVLVRQWPVDGAVTENGAVHVVREGRGVALRERCGDVERRSRRVRLAGLVERVREVVPEARLADDVAARRSDVTWDIGERVRLPAERTALIVQEIHGAGARTTQSSVHLHATFDEDDKATGAIEFLRASFEEDAGAARFRYAFAGDSGNDAACFAAFHTSFGVANVRDHLAKIAVVPRFVAAGAMGEGFAEIARALLDARR
jgi:HAD superfamily hydrolase (TIGR01484 family)